MFILWVRPADPQVLAHLVQCVTHRLGPMLSLTDFAVSLPFYIIIIHMQKLPPPKKRHVKKSSALQNLYKKCTQSCVQVTLFFLFSYLFMFSEMCVSHVFHLQLSLAGSCPLNLDSGRWRKSLEKALWRGNEGVWINGTTTLPHKINYQSPPP